MEVGSAAVNNNTYITNNYGSEDSKPLSEMSIGELMAALADRVGGADGPGAEAAGQAIGQQAGEVVAEMIRDRVDADDSIPEAKKNEINDAVDDAIAANGLDTPDEIADLMAQIKEMQKDFFEEEIQEAVDSTDAGGAGEGKKGKEGGGEGGGNWLVVMAKAMSKIAGNHLEKMIEGQQKLSELEANAPAEGDTEGLAAQASAMTQLTAEIQAHSQMFKMAQETTTTVIKNVGEALNSTVRKQ